MFQINGGIGNDEAAKYIKNEDITKAENMKLLASAKAGDLTWDGNGVTIRRQVPVTIDVAEGGEVQLNGNKNVYVSATADSALNLKGGIDTDGDIRLSAGKGIAIADGTMIRGRNLTLLGGSGDIGASDKYLEMMINGWLMANSGNSIYVHQNGNIPLTLLSAAAGMDAYLHADNGIRMYNGYGMDMGYINAGRTVDLFAKQGDIAAIRILATDAAVNAAAPEGTITLVNVGGELKLADIFDASRADEYKKKKKAEEEAKEEARKKAAEEEARKQAEAEAWQKKIDAQVEEYMDLSTFDEYFNDHRAAYIAYQKTQEYKRTYDKNGKESDKQLYEEQLSGLINLMQLDNFGGKNYTREELALIVQCYAVSKTDDYRFASTEDKEREMAPLKSQLATLAQARVKAAEEAAKQKAAEEEAAKQKAAEEEAARQKAAEEEEAKHKADSAWQEAKASLTQKVEVKVAEYEATAAAIDNLLETNSNIRSYYQEYQNDPSSRTVDNLNALINLIREALIDKGYESYSLKQTMCLWLYAKGDSPEMKETAHSMLTEYAKLNVKAEGAAEEQVASQMNQNAAATKIALEAETSRYIAMTAARGRGESEANVTKAGEEAAAEAKAAAEAAAAEEARNAARQQAAASCFVASSPVLTPEGERPISELAVGDRVITLDRNGKETVGVVTEVMTPREAEIVEVTFSNGTVWRTTESQTVWLGHEQNYEIKEDAVGKKALLRGGESVAVTSVKYTGKYETVYDVLIGEEEDEDVIFVAGIATEGYFTKGERGL